MAIAADTGTPDVISAPHSALDNITVPDANLLFTGDFSRAGHDLVLTGSDGTKLVLQDYFITDTPPALVSPDGAMLTGDVVTSLAGPMFPAQYAQAGNANSGDVPIGQVQTIEGSASVVRANGLTLQLKTGDPVFQGDVVLTGPGSKLGISFVDGTVFSLSADARMVLNSLVFNPEGSNNSMLFSLVEGTFVFTAGQIAPTGNMNIQTPVATMGIRGTTPTVTINSLTGQVNFSLVPDPRDGHEGSYVLKSLTNGEVIGSVTGTGSTWSLTGADGTVTELPKSEEDLLNDQAAINEITTVFNTAQSNNAQQQQQGDPGDTTNSIPGAPPSSGLNTGQPDGGTDGAPQPGNTPPPPPDGDPAPPPPPGQGATNNTDDPPPTGGGPTPPAPAPTGPNVITGTPNAETLTGTSGVDLIDGLGGGDTINALGGDDEITVGPGGGADIIDAGAGNDTLIVSEDSGWVFDGGDGIDTIRIVGDLNIDTSRLTSAAENIEIIDLNKTDANVFTATADDFVTPGTNNTIQFRGDANDTLHVKPELFDQSGNLVEGSFQQAQEVRIIDGLIFDVYQFVDGQGAVLATAEVERGIKVIAGNQVIGDGTGETLTGTSANDLILGNGGDDTIIGDPVETSSNQATIPSTGQSLSVSLNMLDESNADSIDLSGFVSRTALTQPNVNVAFVVDVSGSTRSSSGSTSIGDPNGDGSSNTVLDAEIAGFEALYNSIVNDAGLTNANIAVIPFGSSASTAFSGSATADTSPQNGTPDVLDTLRALRAGGGTNFEAALQQTISFFNGATAGAAFVFFLSDGFGFGAFADEVATLTDPNGINATIQAFGIGSGASATQLDLLDDGLADGSATVVLDPAQLSANLTGSNVTQAEIARVEFLLDGQVVGTIQSGDLTQTPFGLRYDFNISGLDPAQADQVTVRVVANDQDVTTVSTTQTLEVHDGTSGNDTIIGGAGNDSLTGGPGNDNFVFNSVQDGIDTITDFDATQDLLDFTGLLDAVFDKQTDNINDFVKATTDQQTGETTVAVDIDGPGGPAQFTDVAILQGVGAGVDISVAVGDDDTTVSSAVVV